MENKNIRRFCDCKPFKKKTTLSLIKILLALIKEHEGSERTPKYTVYQKIKRLINYGKNYWNNNVQFINYVYLREKEAYKNE